MKKLIITLLAPAALLAACHPLQSQGEAAAERIMRQNVLNPASYHAIDTRVDSLLTDIRYNMDALALAKQILRLEGDTTPDADTRPSAAVAELEAKIRTIDSRLTKGAFTGWRLHHRFRANNMSGQQVDDEVILFVDREMKSCHGILSLSQGKAEEVERLREIIGRALRRGTSDL